MTLFRRIRLNRQLPVIIGVTVFVAGYLVWVWLEPESGTRHRLSASLILLIWLILALQSRRVIHEENLGDSAQSWRYLSVAVWIWAATYTIEGMSVLFFGQPLASPSIADLLRLAGYLAAISFVVTYPVSPPGRFGRLRDALDIAILMIAILTLDWLIFIRPVFSIGIAKPGEVFWISLNPVLDTLLIILLFRLVLIFSKRPERRLFIFLDFAFFALLIADLTRSYLVLNRDTVANPFLDLCTVVFVGLILLTFSQAEGRLRAPETSQDGRRWEIAFRIERLLPLALTYIVVGFIFVDWLSSGMVDWVGIASAGLLVLLLFARQGVIAGQQEMHQFAALVNATSDMAFICDQEGFIRLANPALEYAVGTIETKSKTTNISDFIQIDDYARSILIGASEHGWVGEVAIRKADGDNFPALLSINPLHDWRASETMLAGTAHDLSAIREREDDLRRAMAEIDDARQDLAVLNTELENKVEDRTRELQRMVMDLERLNEDLKALDRLKSEFVALVSHELRAPLTNIRTGVELILDQYPDLSDSARTSLNLVQSETDRLTGFVETILDLSALEAGRFELNLKPIPAKEVAVTARDRLQIDREIERIHLEIPDDLTEMMGDEAALSSVLYHLLDNAIKYAPESEIEIQAWVEDDRVFMSVGDEGPGIPADEREMVFDMFHRLDASDSREVYGYGLGLPMVYRLIEAMSGGIYIDDVEHGTHIVFWLPRAD